MTTLGVRIEEVLEADTDNFVELLELSGLDPAQDIRFMDLRDVDFSGCDLSGIDFTGAQLKGCKFEGSRITDAVFDESQMQLKLLESAQDYSSFFENIPDEIRVRMSDEQKQRDRKALGDACSEQNIEVIKELLTRGVDPDQSNDRHFPLYAVARTGNAEIAKLLLEFGADPNKFYNTRNFSSFDSPLINACSFGNFEVAKALVAYGADIQHSTEGGRNSLSAASAGGYTKIVEFLLDMGVSVRRSRIEDAPLITASEGDHVDTVKLLIERGADVNGQDDLGTTALIEATKNDAIQTAELLLSFQDCDVDATDMHGTSALMASAARGNNRGVDLLLNAGASPIVINKVGKTARQFTTDRSISEKLSRAEAEWNKEI